MAGIMKNDSNDNSFSILTTKALSNINFIHDRMPVILSKDEVDRYLNNHIDISDLHNENVTICFSK